MPWYASLSALLIQGIVWPFAYPVLRYYLKVRIVGKHHIRHAARLRKALQRKHQRKVGVLFVSNHIGELDFARIISGMSPFHSLMPIFFVGDSGKRYNDPTFGFRRHLYKLDTFLKLSGVYPVIRGTKNYETALSTHTQILTSGHSLCIFPEGGYSHKGEIHGGGGYLAESTGCIIVPIFLRKHTHDDGVDVTFGPVVDFASVDTKELGSERYRDIARSILQYSQKNVPQEDSGLK